MAIKDLIYNVEIVVGSLWPLTITLTDDNDVPVNLTGYAVYCDIRDRPGANLLASPTVQITAGSGQIYIFLTPAQTKVFGAAKAVFDVVLMEIADPTNVRTLLRGEVDVFGQITVIQKTRTGATHTGTLVIDGLSSTADLAVGMTITGAGVGVGSTIAVIAANQVTGTVVSTASATVPITFTLLP